MSSVKPYIFEADEFGHAIVSCPECKFKRRVNVNKYRGLDKIFSIKCICQANVVCRFKYPDKPAPTPDTIEGGQAQPEPPLLNVRNDGLVRIKCPGCESETWSNVTRFKERKEVFSVRCACGTEHSFRVRYPDEAAAAAMKSAETPLAAQEKAAQKKAAPPPDKQTPEIAAPLVFPPSPDGGCQIKCPNCSANKHLPSSMIKDPQKVFAVACKCGLNFSFRISKTPAPPPPPVLNNMDELISVTSAGDDLLRAIEGGDPLLLRETYRPEPVIESGGADAPKDHDFEAESLREMLGQKPVEDVPEVEAELAETSTSIPEVEAEVAEQEYTIPVVEAVASEDMAKADVGAALVDEEEEAEDAASEPLVPPSLAPREYEQQSPIIFFPNSKGITRIICPECHFEKQVNAESFRRVQGPVGIQCKCGLQFQCRIEFRQAYRKQTMLAGEYVKQRDNEPGRFVIRDLSLGGAGIKILGPHTIHPGDVLFMRFTLDNALGTDIRKTLKVIHVSGQDVGGTFTEKNYSQDLGYYLMA